MTEPSSLTQVGAQCEARARAGRPGAKRLQGLAAPVRSGASVQELDPATTWCVLSGQGRAVRSCAQWPISKLHPCAPFLCN
jgi:hypothetical protein